MSRAGDKEGRELSFRNVITIGCAVRNLSRAASIQHESVIHVETHMPSTTYLPLSKEAIIMWYKQTCLNDLWVSSLPPHKEGRSMRSQISPAQVAHVKVNTKLFLGKIFYECSVARTHREKASKIDFKTMHLPLLYPCWCYKAIESPNKRWKHQMWSGDQQCSCIQAMCWSRCCYETREKLLFIKLTSNPLFVADKSNTWAMGT